MAKRDRQRRYKLAGGAAGLVKVETLVPPEGRARILKLAAELRAQHRRGRVDVAAMVARVRTACKPLPRRYASPTDIDNLVVTGVNVPFPKPIDARTLAGAIRKGAVPPGYAGHFERFLGETPLVDILRFCDRHRIGAAALAEFVRGNRARLALRRPDLEEHLDAAVPAA